MEAIMELNHMPRGAVIGLRKRAWLNMLRGGETCTSKEARGGIMSWPSKVI
ncbi:hypothetical protein R6Q57_008648 [Mikania cordata]